MGCNAAQGVFVAFRGLGIEPEKIQRMFDPFVSTKAKGRDWIWQYANQSSSVTSVGVSTTRFVRNEGAVIRYNMGRTFVLLYLMLISVAAYWPFPSAPAT